MTVFIMERLPFCYECCAGVHTRKCARDKQEISATAVFAAPQQSEPQVFANGQSPWANPLAGHKATTTFPWQF
jgi:hypothetical protein